jgi:hypothetical protein
MRPFYCQLKLTVHKKNFTLRSLRSVQNFATEITEFTETVFILRALCDLCGKVLNLGYVDAGGTPALHRALYRSVSDG